MTNLLSKLESWGPDIQDFDRILGDETRDRNALQVALAKLAREGAESKPLWPALKPWAVLLEHRARLSYGDPSLPKEGEVWDMALSMGLPSQRQSSNRRAELQRHLITAFWPRAGKLMASRLDALDGVEQQTNWFEEWREAFLRARQAEVDTPGRMDAIKDCDCLLELIARLFESSNPALAPAADTWFNSVDAQAVAYAQAECCRKNDLVNPSADMTSDEQARPLIATLATVWRARLAAPVVSGEHLVAGLAAHPGQGPAKNRPGTTKQREEWIDLLLRHWAARDTVIEELLARRDILRLEDRNITEQPEIPWAPGHEMQVALFGPSASGKTSLMFASKVKGYVDVATAYRKLGDDPTADQEAVNQVEQLWRAGVKTEGENLVARTKVENFASFTFFDVRGEQYFRGRPDPSGGKPASTYSKEFLQTRYARRPPSLIMLMANGGQLDAFTIKPDSGSADYDSSILADLGTLINVIKESPIDTEEAIRDQINASRPVMLLISHTDKMVEELTRRYTKEVWNSTVVETVATADLEKSLTSEVLRLADFDLVREDRAHALARLKRDRKLLLSPSRLRIVLDTVDKMFAVVQKFSAGGLSNLQILFLQPFDQKWKPEDSLTAYVPDFPGVDTLWAHLRATAVPKSIKARELALRRSLIEQLKCNIDKKIEPIAQHASAFRLPSFGQLNHDTEFQNAASAIGLSELANLVVAGTWRPSTLSEYLKGNDARRETEFAKTLDKLCNTVEDLDNKILSAISDVMTVVGVPTEIPFSTFMKSYNAVGRYPYTEDQDLNLDWLRDARKTYTEIRSQRGQGVGDISGSDAPKPIDRVRRFVEDIDKTDENSVYLKILLDLVEEQKRILDQRITEKIDIALHGVHGALYDMCKWRNRGRDEADYPEGKWIKSNEARRFKEIVDFNSRDEDKDNSDSEWVSIEQALLQLRDFNPRLPTLHVGLFESDRGKVYAVERTLKDKSISRLAVAALKDLRDLGRLLRTRGSSTGRLRSLASLEALRPLLAALGYRPETVFKAIAEGKDWSILGEIRQAERDLRNLKGKRNPAYEYVTSVLGNNKQIHREKIREIGLSLKKSLIQADDRDIIVGHDGREDTLGVRAPHNAVIFARLLVERASAEQLSPLLSDHKGNVTAAFIAELNSLSERVGACATSLAKLHETLRELLLYERCAYVDGAELLNGHSDLAQKLGTLIQPVEHEGEPNPLKPFEDRYNDFEKVVTELLKRA